MAGIGDMFSGKQQKMAAEAQERERRRVEDEKAELDELERGQRQAAQTGGGGLLAFVDDKLKGTLG